MYSCAQLLSLLQSSVSHDPSEITLIWCFDDFYQYWKLWYFCENHVTFVQD